MRNPLITTVVVAVVVTGVTLAVAAEGPRILTLVVAPHGVLLVVQILIVDAAHAAGRIANRNLAWTTSAETRLRLVNLWIMRTAAAIRVTVLVVPLTVAVLSLLAIWIKTRPLVLLPTVGGPSGWIHTAGRRGRQGGHNLIGFVGVFISPTSSSDKRCNKK